MAESMHAVGLRVDKTEDLKDVLKQAFASGKVCIIDCPVDYAENTKLTEHLKQMIAELG